MRLQIAPISVLEFAQIALDAGGRVTFISNVEYARLSLRRKVPSGVLSVLPGPGITTGKKLVSHPLIRKVDITVKSMLRRLPCMTLNNTYQGRYRYRARNRKHRWQKLGSFYC